MSEPRATYSASGATPSDRIPQEAPAFTPAPIRYRVFVPSTGRMHFPDREDGEDIICTPKGSVFFWDRYSREDFEEPGAVALLSTGLHDADGREVFEGDILLIDYSDVASPGDPDPHTFLAPVGWDAHAGAWGTYDQDANACEGKPLTFTQMSALNGSSVLDESQGALQALIVGNVYEGLSKTFGPCTPHPDDAPGSEEEELGIWLDGLDSLPEASGETPDARG